MCYKKLTAGSMGGGGREKARGGGGGIMSKSVGEKDKARGEV